MMLYWNMIVSGGPVMWVIVLCSLLAVVAGQCSGHLLRQKASVTPDSLGAALLVLMGLIRLAGQAT